MRRPRRRFLALLLLLMVALSGTSAVTLRRRDSLDPWDLVWEGEDGYYKKNDGLYCQKCPAGTYIAEECKVQKGFGRCEPCAHGEYMEYPNAFQWCRDCSKCREDQVEQSPCQPVRNTECVCRNGTFCSPEHPCEMCRKCQPRCPEGQVMLKPCRPDSDLQCGPAMDTVPHHITVIIGLAAFVSAFVIAFCCWKCCSSPGDGTPSSRRPYEMVCSMFQKLPWYRRVNTAAEDNAANLQRQQARAELQVPRENGTPRRRLVPVPGVDPNTALRVSFDTLAEELIDDHWKKLGRRLGVGQNDINKATSGEGFSTMLSVWHNMEGSRASVNTLLDRLHQMHLGGVAERFSSRLVQDGWFQYETS